MVGSGWHRFSHVGVARFEPVGSPRHSTRPAEFQTYKNPGGPSTQYFKVSGPKYQ